jgi:hypothetical protein
LRRCFPLFAVLQHSKKDKHLREIFGQSKVLFFLETRS